MKHSEKVYIVKQAFGFASPIGAMYGLSKAPEGEKGEGFIHGLLRGAGVDLGSTFGGLPGFMVNQALNDTYDGKAMVAPAKTPMGRGLQKGIGPVLTVLGVLGGGYGGHQLMDKLMGRAPYDK